MPIVTLHPTRGKAIGKLLLALVFLSLAFATLSSSAAPAPPETPTPTPPPVEPDQVEADSSHTPPSPDNLPPEIEQARAQAAMEAVLAKQLAYWGPRYQATLGEVKVEGEWAYAKAEWQSEAQILNDSIHILAHRSADGAWQALMPGSDGLYLQWVDAVPESLVPDGQRDQLRGQAAKSNFQQHLFLPTSTIDVSDRTEIEQTIQQAIAKHDDVLAFLIFDVQVQAVEIEPDRRWAVAELFFVNRQTQEVIPTEPGIALAQHNEQGWKVVLQADSEWSAWLDSAPENLLSPEAKEWWRVQSSRELNIVSTFGGYKLPWPAGQTKELYRSVSHGVGGSEEFAFDFGNGNMFELRAAKSGSVKYAVWTYPNGYYYYNETSVS